MTDAERRSGGGSDLRSDIGWHETILLVGAICNFREASLKQTSAALAWMCWVRLVGERLHLISLCERGYVVTDLLDNASGVRTENSWVIGDEDA